MLIGRINCLYKEGCMPKMLWDIPEEVSSVNEFLEWFESTSRFDQMDSYDNSRKKMYVYLLMGLTVYSKLQRHTPDHRMRILSLINPAD